MRSDPRLFIEADLYLGATIDLSSQQSHYIILYELALHIDEACGWQSYLPTSLNKALPSTTIKKATSTRDGVDQPNIGMDSS